MTYLFLFIRRSMFIFLFALTLCLMAHDCFATQWAKTYGGSGSDSVSSIKQTRDGGYIIAGATGSFGAGSSDAWVLKLDSSGNVSWQKAYGGGTSDEFSSIQQTSDGGYIVAGSTYSFGVALDAWVLKLDSNGNISWQKIYGEDGDESFYSIKQTTDGGYIVRGKNGVDIWILKLDSNGNVSWQKSYDSARTGKLGDAASSIQQTTDGGYIVTCSTFYSDGELLTDAWVLKLDSNGNVTWQKLYEISSGPYAAEYFNDIIQTRDGGYIIAGDYNDFTWILKLDSNGSISWQKTYYSYLGVSSVKQTRDEGYIVWGTYGAGSYDILILKLDSNGNISWQKTYGGMDSEGTGSIQQTTDGGYIVAGYTTSFGAGSYDIWILKLDSNGNINNADFIGESSLTGAISAGIEGSHNVTIGIPRPTITETVVTPQDTSAEIETQVFVSDWFPMDPPTQDDLNGVWGYISSALTHEFYAVGENGLVIHFDGTSWTQTGNLSSFALNGVWGSSETEIFTVGERSTIFHYGDHSGEYSWIDMEPGFTTNLNDVWGSSATDVYTVGEDGFIAHYDGESWTEVTITPAVTETLTGIWGSASDNYVAVGEGGTIIEYDGEGWTDVTPDPAPQDLSEVWGSRSDNIYAVGKGGTIIHYNGTNWLAGESPTAANLRGIWGSSGDNIFAVGEHGSILHYDGVSWTKMDSGSHNSLISTFGTLNPRVMVVGYEGAILTLQGPSVQGKICDSCTGEGIGDVLVEFDKDFAPQPPYQSDITNSYGIHRALDGQAGPHILSFTHMDYIPASINLTLPNGDIFDHTTYLVPEAVEDYQDCISGTVTRDVDIGVNTFEKGVQNMEVKLYQGSSLLTSKITDIGGNYHFTGLAAGTYRVEPVIVGSECTPDMGYHTVTVPTTNQYIFELTCPEPEAGTVAYWDKMNSPVTDEVVLYGIWGSSGSNIFAVGDSGTIVRYNGTTWSEQESGTGSNLQGVWGSSAINVYAVGTGGTILKTKDGGGGWNTMISNTLNDLSAIWGSSGSDVYAVGDKGEIFHYDGNVSNIWDHVYTYAENVKLLGVWGTASDDVYVVGNSHKDEYWERTVLHFNGTTWTPVGTGNGVTLMSPWGTSTSDITVAGSFGSIMKYDGIDWKQIGGPTEKTFNGMWGSSGTDIFAVGFNGVIAHYDGTAWTSRQPDESNRHDLHGIWGVSATEVYAVGDMGRIFTYTGDIDGDGAMDDADNCIEISNPNQYDGDNDGFGNVCDNCPLIPNGPLLGICTHGTIGETCTSNTECDVTESDGFCNKSQANSDYDELGNACDNCPFDTNAGQEDTGDGDGVGDLCDNCPTTSNFNQENNDHDGAGDVCDSDDDNDGIPDTVEQDGDPDGDEIPNWFDTDSDGDGVYDSEEAGSNPSTPVDTDNNGTPDYLDDDSDGDGELDDTDNCRLIDNPGQADDYPEGGNNCGNECECEGNFNADEDNDVDGTDASTFKTDFGRGGYNSPCIASDPCNGDFECDGDVDGSDASVFKADFGRGGYNNPCPSCGVAGEWCTY